MLKIGFASQIITPERGVGLAGYFNQRPNRGVLDDVFVKALLFEQDGVVTGFVVYDLCGASDDMVERLRKRLVEKGFPYGENLILSCTHTHTGPEVRRNLEQVANYLEELTEKAACAVKEAFANLRPGTLEVASTVNNPYGYVRRFWMKNGKVTTNPGKLNPEIDRVEGDFDRTVSVVAVRQEGRIAALLVNLANHGDTIGGDLVSADWFGRMEREIQYAFGDDVPVLTLTDASGDVNHFDVTTDRDQTSYQEALRIGRGYGELVFELLKELKPLPELPMTFEKSVFNMPLRTVTAAQLAEARKVLETVPKEDLDARDMTSEDLAKGNNAVLRMFAERVLSCEGNENRSQACELLRIGFGEELAFLSLPGEPFNGIARGIRAESPFKRTLIAELAMGKTGYIPMDESFERGGYETEPMGTSPDIGTASKLIEAAAALLKK